MTDRMPSILFALPRERAPITGLEIEKITRTEDAWCFYVSLLDANGEAIFRNWVHPD